LDLFFELLSEGIFDFAAGKKIRPVEFLIGYLVERHVIRPTWNAVDIFAVR